MNGDYGLYGKCGNQKAPIELNLNKCNCGTEPLIKCHYDDTPGWKDTSYVIHCPNCGWCVRETSAIDNAAIEWNKRMENFDLKYEQSELVIKHLVEVRSRISRCKTGTIGRSVDGKIMDMIKNIRSGNFK